MRTTMVGSNNPASTLGGMRVVALLLILSCLVCQRLLAQQTIPDRGNLTLDIKPGENAAEKNVAELLGRPDGIVSLVNDINEEINFQDGVVLMLAPWPEPNATYDSLDNKIIISYRLILEIKDLFQDDEDFWYPNVEQTVLHEVGHALMDVNDIPLYEDENPEVVADQLAFFIMSEFYDSEEDLGPVVEHYLLRDEKTGSGNVAATSQHIPDYERANNYLCWIAGKTPEFADQLADILESRDCRSEYEDLVEDWEDRLLPSWKDSSIRN